MDFIKTDKKGKPTLQQIRAVKQVVCVNKLVACWGYLPHKWAFLCFAITVYVFCKAFVHLFLKAMHANYIRNMQFDLYSI